MCKTRKGMNFRQKFWIKSGLNCFVVFGLTKVTGMTNPIFIQINEYMFNLMNKNFKVAKNLN